MLREKTKWDHIKCSTKTRQGKKREEDKRKEKGKKRP